VWARATGVVFLRIIEFIHEFFTGQDIDFSLASVTNALQRHTSDELTSSVLRKCR
jgi:hypothetical protein